VFVLFCVKVEALRLADPPSKEPYGIKRLKNSTDVQRAIKPWKEKKQLYSSYGQNFMWVLM
jgi:hypothetical protein